MIHFWNANCISIKTERNSRSRKGNQAKRPDVRQRATVIRLLHMGLVAEQQMVSVPTIYNWHKLWREQGVEGLANKQKTGRKPKATDEYCLKLETLLAKDPSECGYRFAIWTSDRLRIHQGKETGILLSETVGRNEKKSLRDNFELLSMDEVSLDPP